MILRTVRDHGHTFTGAPWPFAPGDIHGAWDWFNVPRIPASADAAQMVGVEPFRDVSDQFCVRHSVTKKIFPPDAHGAISLALRFQGHPARRRESFGQTGNLDRPLGQLVEDGPKLSHMTSPSQTSGMCPGRGTSPFYVTREV